MVREEKLAGWETLALGLAVGLLAHAAPAATAVLLMVVLAGLFRTQTETHAPIDHTPLAALGLVAFAGMVGGPSATIAAALVWRTGAELGARTPDAKTVSGGIHLWAAPAAALLYRLDAPHIVVIGAVCVAGVAWMDWLVRRLADWRLDTPGVNDARAFVGAQATVIAPLLLFPTPQTCLAALVAIGVARAVTWTAPGTLAYATAR